LSSPLRSPLEPASTEPREPIAIQPSELPAPDPGTPFRRVPRLVRLALGSAAVLLSLFLLRVPLLSSVAGFLSIEDRLEPAGLIYVLGGEPETRPFLAADLYRRGLAPRVVLPRSKDNLATRLGMFPNETDATVRLLARLGVPQSSIVVLGRKQGGTASTVDDAVELREFLRRNPTPRIIAVTSSYHTRRARWSLRRALKGIPVEIRMAGSRHPEFNERNWWRSETGLILVFEEYVKFVHNLLYR